MANKIGKIWYAKNKFGGEELLDEQCGNKCTCSENQCQYDDVLWEMHYIYQAYRRNLLAAQRKKKQEGE